MSEACVKTAHALHSKPFTPPVFDFDSDIRPFFSGPKATPSHLFTGDRKETISVIKANVAALKNAGFLSFASHIFPSDHLCHPQNRKLLLHYWKGKQNPAYTFKK